MNYALNLIASLGIGFSLLFGLGALFNRRGLKRKRLVTAVFFGCLSLSFILPALHALALDVTPVFYYLIKSSQLLIGPLANIYLFSVLRPRQPLTRSHLLYFAHIPLLILTYALLISGDGATAALTLKHNRALIFLHHILFITPVLLDLLFNKQNYKENRPLARAVLLLSTWYILALTLAIIATYLSHRWLIASGILFAPALLLQFLLGLQIPGLLPFTIANPESKSSSTLGNTDQSLLEKRLQNLMKVEKVFLDEDLNLGGLARMMGVNQVQLSEFINTSRGLNFNNFINGFRVQESCRLLKDEPDRSIISIAFASGFNSKASFNRAFTRVTGKTPRAFRKD